MPIWSWLTKTWRSLRATSSPDPGLTSLDVAVITERFNLLAEAKQLAKLGLPAFHSKALTQVELEVVRYIEHAREQIHRQASLDFEKIDDSIAEVHASQLDLQNGRMTADFERKAMSVFNEQRAWLEKLGQKAKRRSAELERFRQTHDLQRDAVYPEGAGVFARYAVLLLLVVIEGLFNASFFAEGLSSGLIGGFSYAATLAALNVVVMFLLGKTLLRWSFHRQTGLKLLGLAGLALSALYTSVVALAIAHLRTAIIAGSTEPTKEAWATLIYTPFALNDLLSWVLFLITLGFGLAALLDGLFMDDLYPGYGELTRRERMAVEEFEEEFEEVRQDLEDLKQENLDVLEQEVVRGNQLVARCKQLIDDKKNLHKSWLKAVDDSEVAVYAALRIFRAENERHRHDGMRPAYFDTLPSLNPVLLPKPASDKFEEDYAELVRKTRELHDTLPDRKGKVYALFDQHVSQLNFIQH
jgi:thiosulfate reductase cytochrome b subunit